MIFYFSGTGNSKWVAKHLAKNLNEHLVFIPDAMRSEEYRYTLAENESIGFVFPTYSWGPAPVMLQFIANLVIENYTASTYCYMVTTCGDDVGLSVDVWRKALGKINGNAAFSVQMPNNYILLPGFDVDSKELEQEKIFKARTRIEEISMSIAERRCTTEVVEGSWKWFKTRVIRPGFLRHAMSPKPFNVLADRCTHCGLCSKECPMQNITIQADGTPLWGDNCAMCLSCIHRCPTQAIQYGKISIKKGRYFLTPNVH